MQSRNLAGMTVSMWSRRLRSGFVYARAATLRQRIEYYSFLMRSPILIEHAIAEPCWDDGIDVVSATPEWIRIRARCDFKTADRVLQFLDEVAELPNAEKSAVGAAFREMLMNAIEHGGRLDPNQQVEISYVCARHMVKCRISDPGEGFTLDEIPHAAIANPADDLLRHVEYREARGMRPGGFGVLLAQKLVDELVYNQQGNEVILIKYLDLAPRLPA